MLKGSCNTGKKGGKVTARGTTTTTKARKMQTKADHAMVLRKALFEGSGHDKNVLLDFKPFTHWNRAEGLDVTIEFSARLSKALFAFAFELAKSNMEGVYDAAGLEWSDAEQQVELREQSNRFLVLRRTQADEDGPPGEPLGYALFRFTLQGDLLGQMAGEPALLIYDLQLKPEAQRKGLGSHLLVLLELIARKQGMSFLQVFVVEENEGMEAFIDARLNGFEVDAFEYAGGEDADAEEGYYVLTKELPAPKPRAAAPSKAAGKGKAAVGGMAK